MASAVKLTGSRRKRRAFFLKLTCCSRHRIVLNLNREMKDPKKRRWLTLLAALALLYAGIESVFFVRIAGSDLLPRIEKTLAILVGTLLITVSISLFVAAWTIRPVTARNTNSIKGKLLAYALCAAPLAFVFGLFLVRTIKYSNILDFAVVVLSGVSLMFVLFWTRRAVRRLASSETARKHVTQFLWSCLFFSILSLGLGMAVSGFIWFSTDLMRRFNVVFWSALTGVAIYPVLRDAERLADAASPSQITSR